MARGRKAGPTRLDMRRQSDAAEARDAEAEKPEDETEEDDDDEEEDDEAEEEEAEAADEEAAADDDDGGDDDDEDGPKKKKAKPKAKAKPKKEPTAKKPAVKRTRAVKEIRMKASWVVYDNGGKKVETFPFNQKADAEELLARKVEEKKTTFYLQLLKEPLE